MTELRTLLAAIESQFEADSALSTYVKSINYGEEDIDVNERGIYPFINLNIYDVMSGPASGMNNKQMIRYTMPLVISFACKDKMKKQALYGSATKKGCWQIYTDIINAIDKKRNFGIQAIANENFRPDYMSDAFQHIDSSEWIGQGMMVYEIYTDVWQR